MSPFVWRMLPWNPASCWFCNQMNKPNEWCVLFSLAKLWSLQWEFLYWKGSCLLFVKKLKSWASAQSFSFLHQATCVVCFSEACCTCFSLTEKNICLWNMVSLSCREKPQKWNNSCTLLNILCSVPWRWNQGNGHCGLMYEAVVSHKMHCCQTFLIFSSCSVPSCLYVGNNVGYKMAIDWFLFQMSLLHGDVFMSNSFDPLSFVFHFCSCFVLKSLKPFPLWKGTKSQRVKRKVSGPVSIECVCLVQVLTVLLKCRWDFLIVGLLIQICMRLVV